MLPFTLFENVDQAKSYLKKNGIPETDWVYKLIRELFKGKEGYIGWVTRVAYDDIVPHSNKQEVTSTLTNLATKLSTDRHIIDSLPKPVIEYKTYEEFIDACEKQVLIYKAKKMLDEFPSTQKSLMRMGNIRDISLLSKLFDDEANKVFLRKIAAYKTRDVLIEAIKRFIDKTGGSDFDSLLRELHKEGLSILHADEENNLVIARVLDYEQCRAVGSRTSWCIVRNASTFRSYVPDGLTRQYVIYQTDLPTSNNNNIIGATYNLQGYRTAHNRVDGHVSEESLKRMLSERGYDIKGLGLKREDLTEKDINSASVKDLKRIGMTLEEIVKIKKIYRPLDLTQFSKEELDRYDLLNKTAIDGSLLKKFTKEEIISKKLLDRIEQNSLHIETLLELGFSRVEIQKIPDLMTKLYDDDRKYYDKYLKKNRAELIKRGAYDLQYGSRWSDRDDRYDVGKTLGIMRWYNIGPKDFTMEQLEQALNNVSGYEFENIRNYLDQAGYKYTEDELVKFLTDVSRGHTDELDRNIAFINMGIDKYDEIIKEVMSKHKPATSWEKEKIQKVLKPEHFERFQEIDKRNIFVQETLAAGGAYWRKQQNPLSPSEYWKKWGDYGSMLDLNKFKSEYEGYRYGYGREMVLSYILLAAINNKFDYLYNLKFDWESGKGHRNWATHTFMGALMDTICGINLTNGDATIKAEESLTDGLREKLYKWVIEYVWPKITDKVYFKYDMLVSYFIFDKTKFNQYVDEVKKMKDNYTYTTNKDVEKTITFRMVELQPIVSFFKDEYDRLSKTWYFKTHDASTVIGYFQEFLNYFLSGIKMLKTERNATIRILYKYNHRRDEISAYNKAIGDAFNVDFREYRDNQVDIIEKSAKESVITNYSTYCIRENLNEGIRDKMSPKSYDEIKTRLGDLSIENALKMCNASSIKITDYLPTDKIKTLVKDKSPQEVLFFASEYGISELITTAVKMGADLDEECEGFTALMMASEKGHAEIVEMLIENGADVNSKNYLGTTALMKASMFDHTAIVDILIRNGANVNERGNRGTTALMWAYSIRTAKILIDNGADVNAQNDDGSTPLMFASEEGFIEVAEFLIKNGANLNTKKEDGKTALMLAIGGGQLETADMLIKNGAKK